MKQNLQHYLFLLATLCMMACNSTAVFDEHKEEITEIVKVWITMIEWNQEPSYEELALLSYEMKAQFGSNYMTIENLNKYNGSYKSTADEFLKKYNEASVSFSKPKLRKLNDSELNAFDGAYPDEEYWCFQERNTGIHLYAQFGHGNDGPVQIFYDLYDVTNWIKKLG